MLLVAVKHVVFTVSNTPLLKVHFFQFNIKQYIIDEISGVITKLQQACMAMGYISFFIALFLVISGLVNRRMIINGYTPLQALAIIVFSLPLSFFLINQRSNVCYDEITFAMGSRNRLCETQGLMLVFGYHAVVLFLVARVLSVFMLVVYRRNIPRVYLTVIVIGISTAFTCLSNSHIRFNGGSVCGPAHQTMRRLVQIPILSYSFVGLFFQFATAGYVTYTMMQVRMSVLRARIPDDMQQFHKDIGMGTKFKILAKVHLKALRLLWRTYVTSLFLSGVIVFAAAQYIISTTRNGGNDRLGTQEWIACVIKLSQTADYNGDTSQCSHYLQGEGIYARTLVGMILILAFAILFLFTELRMFLFHSWYRLLKAGPRALFSRKRSDAILDTIQDDELSTVWLPERLKARFMGSWHPSVQDEEATQRDLEYQIIMFEKRKQQQEEYNKMQLVDSTSEDNSSSSTAKSGKTVKISSRPISALIQKPSKAIISKRSKVSSRLDYRERAVVTSPRPSILQSTPRLSLSLTQTQSQSQSQSQRSRSMSYASTTPSQSNWIRLFLSNSEQRHKRDTRHLSRKRKQRKQSSSHLHHNHDKRKHKSASSSVTSLSTRTSIASGGGGVGECSCGGNGSGDIDPSLNKIREVDENNERVDETEGEGEEDEYEEDDEEEELDFMAFLNNNSPPPRR